jgi:hypothetical protein
MQLVPYILIAAALFSTLALFITVKREIFGQARRQKKRIEAMVIRLDEAQRPAVVPETATPFVPAPLRAGLNLNKRVHAMRMLRRGEEVSHIAAALGVPRKEIELLIRVQALGKARVASAGSDQS